jgi:Spy/CpxP family protein refolding chaperone
MNSLFGRMRLLGVALLAATFVAGALSGAAIERVLGADEPEVVRPGNDEGARRSYVIDQIEMTDEQRSAIDGILERRSERMRMVWQEVEPRMDAVTDSARMDIMGVLSPEQRTEYERKLEERRRKRDSGRR